jgi:hypothetical protein
LQASVVAEGEVADLVHDDVIAVRAAGALLVGDVVGPVGGYPQAAHTAVGIGGQQKDWTVPVGDRVDELVQIPGVGDGEGVGDGNDGRADLVVHARPLSAEVPPRLLAGGPRYSPALTV